MDTTRALRRLGIILSLTGLLITTSGCLMEDLPGEGQNDEPLGEAAQPIYWNGHDYLFFLSTVTWDQAQANCKANGYNLVSINSSAEESWLYTMQTQKGGGFWWTGYNDKGYEGVWVWDDASPPGYTNWGPGQPDNYNGNQNCMADNWDNNNQWNDAPCYYPLKFICERNY